MLMGNLSAGRGKGQSRTIQGRPRLSKVLNAKPSAEEIAFCDLVVQLCPKINYVDLLERVMTSASERRERIRRLQKSVRARTYHVPPSAAAQALLRDMDPGWLA